tara:strand:- start:157 stop:453 length:297 start_codon:yes stop_codon:yes gene_type:complete
MKLIKIISEKKFILINIFLFSYIFINLLDGERGLLSYYDKKNLKDSLIFEKNLLSNQLIVVEKKNRLLTEEIDLDYLEMMYRIKFMVGKPDEKIYSSE